MKLKLEEVQRLAEEEFGKLMPDVELVKVKVKPLRLKVLKCKHT